MSYIDDENEEEFELDYIKIIKRKRNSKEDLWDEYLSNSKFVGYKPINNDDYDEEGDEK